VPVTSILRLVADAVFLQSIVIVGLAVGSGLGVGIGVTVGSEVGDGVGVGVENEKVKPLACGEYSGFPFCVKVIVEAAARKVNLEITRANASKRNSLEFVTETPNTCFLVISKR
jgi:hypothetical protein